MYCHDILLVYSEFWLEKSDSNGFWLKLLTVLLFCNSSVTAHRQSSVRCKVENDL